MQLDMTVHSFTAALIDDRSHGGQLEVMTVRFQVFILNSFSRFYFVQCDMTTTRLLYNLKAVFQDMDIKFERKASAPESLSETTGRVSLGIEVLFLNSAVDAKGKFHN